MSLGSAPYLDHVAAHAASTLCENGHSRLERHRAVKQGVIRCHPGRERGRSFFYRQATRCLDQIIVVHDDPSPQRPIVFTAAQNLIDSEGPHIISGKPVVGVQCHSIALRPLRVWTDFFDDASAVATWHEVRLGFERVIRIVIDDENVAKVQGGGLDANESLAGSGLRDGRVEVDEGDGTRGADLPCLVGHVEDCCED